MTEHHFPKTLPDGALLSAADKALPDIPFDPVPASASAAMAGARSGSGRSSPR